MSSSAVALQSQLQYPSHVQSYVHLRRFNGRICWCASDVYCCEFVGVLWIRSLALTSKDGMWRWSWLSVVIGLGSLVNVLHGFVFTPVLVITSVASLISLVVLLLWRYAVRERERQSICAAFCARFDIQGAVTWRFRKKGKRSKALGVVQSERESVAIDLELLCKSHLLGLWHWFTC